MANRRLPRLATFNYRTFRISSPIKTHFRKATCAEVNCEAYINGWSLPKANLDPQMLYLATHSGKSYKEYDLNGTIYLVYSAGQTCFNAAKHVISLQRPEFYFAGRGDYRSFSPRRSHKYERSDQWLDDFATHQARNKQLVDRG